MLALLTAWFIMFVINSSKPEQKTNYREPEPVPEVGYVDVFEVRLPDSVKVSVWFSPSLEITDYIRNTSLKDLIKANKGKLSSFDQSLYEKYCNYEKKRLSRFGFEWIEDYKSDNDYYSYHERECFTIGPIFLSGEMLSVEEHWLEIYLPARPSAEFKMVPASSNLAKVYYLEDKVGFQVDNPDFVSYIESEMEDEQNMRISQEQEERKDEIARKWEEYL